MLSTLPFSITTISPGAISRMNSAPMMSSPQVSDDRTQASSPTRPRTSGRTPSASRTPISLVRVIATMLNAPSTRRSASLIRSEMFFWIERAIRWMMHSLSDED